jgi:DNA-binding MarR family transcriptional regulator
MWTEFLSPDLARHFDDDHHRERTVAVLQALSLYRAAEAAMRRRARETVGMGESDVLALRYLLRAQLEGRDVAPKDITSYLGVSSASTTALLDRLEKAGRIRRDVSPSDRRALIIVPTVSDDDAIRSMLGDVHPLMVDVAAQLDPATAAAIIQFLDNMHQAVDNIGTTDEVA